MAMPHPPATPPATPYIVGLGEALFDVFKSGPRLGGAPLNVAVHAHRLLAPHGGSAVAVSRIAEDQLGQKLLQQVQAYGLAANAIQRHAPDPTGRVDVEQHDDGTHAFHIARPSAWDHLEFTDEAHALATRCAAVAFGSLAQRSEPSRSTIRSFLAAAPRAIKLFDVNLRSSDGQDFYDAGVLAAGCDAAELVKLNDEELQTVCDLTGVADAEALVDHFNLRGLIFTRGAEGTAAWMDGRWIEGEPATYHRVDGADTVGAGDACSAGLLSALVLGAEMEQALNVANHMGAFVAGQIGATPDLPDHILKLLP